MPALESMIEALRIEVNALRRQGATTRIELRQGEQTGTAEGCWLYRFLIMEEIPLRDDSPVRVLCGQRSVAGAVVSFQNGILTLALEADLGPNIPEASLVVDNSFILERLKDCLEEIARGHRPFERALAERVLQPDHARTATAALDPAIGARFNREQAQALQQALERPVLYIWGPPGTGKTTTLAGIVEAHYRAGRSVLLVSNTNIAVDTVLEAVARRLKDDPEFSEGIVLRYGPVMKEELRRTFGNNVVLDEIVARLGEALHREKEQLTGELTRLQEERERLTTALKNLERLASAHRSASELERTLPRLRATATDRQRAAEALRAHAERRRADLDRALRMGGLRRFLSGLHPDRLRQEIAAADHAAQTARQAVQALAADIATREATLRSVRQEITQLTAATLAYPPAEAVRVQLRNLERRQNEITNRLNALDREIADLQHAVLAKCRILATTVYRTYLRQGVTRTFDVAVIDEASMLMPPLVYYAAGLATQAVVVAGDFRQLPPIVAADHQLARDWLKRDVFELAGIPDRLRRGEAVPYLVTLCRQYRMREPICELVNALFYPDAPLQSDQSVRVDPPPSPLGSAPLLYIDTSPWHPWATFRVTQGTWRFSRFNIFHALLVRNIVIHLAEAGYLPDAGVANEAVGVVAPYAAQARLIQTLLQDRLGDRAAGIAATVHRFQGNEKATMVLDLTDSLGAPLGQFFRSTRIEEDGARLLNVAASRARHHLVLIGNFEYVMSEAPAAAIVRRLLAHVRQHGQAINAQRLLPIAARDWIDGVNRVLPATFTFEDGAAGIFNEQNFYPAFRSDLARAQHAITIFSPFLTEHGTSRWIDLLRAARARGVDVRIVTRPPQQALPGHVARAQGIIDELRALGITVDLRRNMHEKIAVLDGAILWHGSLNILSHQDSHESMLRVENPAACSQIARLLSLHVADERGSPLFAARENPTCPACGSPTVWKNGRYGI